MRPEDQVLLNCARQEMPPELAAATRDLLASSSLDWPRLLENAWRHGVASLLHRHLSAQALASLVPNESKDALRQYYVRAAFRSQTHLAALNELLEACEKEHVPVVLLKGAALCLTTYRAPALRPFADIDLLVSEADVDPAIRVLGSCGYSLAPELISAELSRKFHSNLPLVKPGDRPVHVELHWRLTDRFSGYAFAEIDLWQRARRAAVGQSHALVLEPHDVIIYLAAHLDKHGYLNQALAGRDDAATWVLDELSANRLIWFSDLHEIITGNSIDWQLIEQRCDEADLREVVGSTLMLLHDLLGTEGIPDILTRHVRPRFSKRFALGLAVDVAQSEQRRAFFRRHILATRKGFELRLVRLLDLWSYIFPRRSRSIGHSVAAIAQCAQLFFALIAARLRRL